MRTRFAPSPTGLLHVGGLRTALYAYLIAKQTKDHFLVRIEDTDQERSVPGAIENMLRTLHWAEVDPDEGVMLKDGIVDQVGSKGPYIQSERLDLYKKYADELIKKGYAYYAFDTKEEIEQMRTEQQAAGNQAPKYDYTIRMRMKNQFTMSEEEVQAKIDAGDEYVIRMKIPEGEVIEWTDDIRGKVQFKTHTIDDQVLMKSDGFPTYHLAHVVDDHLMDIGIIIRGEEWLSSTPKHLLLFQWFGWDEPRFAHVPLLLNKDKSKLSKRQNDVSVEDYIEKGYLPEVLLNFLALLGWNPGTTQELFTMKELIDAFSLDRIQKGGAIFDTDKLDWLQGQWIRKIDPKDFAERIRPIVADKFAAAESDPHFEERAGLIQERLTFFHEAPDMLQFYYDEPTIDQELLANKKQKVTKEILPEVLSLLIDLLHSIDDWSEDSIKEIVFAACEEKDYKRGQLLWPLRAALTGLPFSPGAFEVATALGKEKTIKRLQAAKDALS